MTDTQADLTERARQFRRGLTALRLEVHHSIVDDLEKLAEAALQSEREAAAAGFQCPACNWHKGHEPAEWFREEVKQRGFLWWQNQVEAAAAEARRALLEEIEARCSDPGSWPSAIYREVAEEVLDAVRGLASPPAPQEETR